MKVDRIRCTLATEAYHEANRFLIEKGVLPEVNLRTLIRRTVDRAPVVASRPMGLDEFKNTGNGGNSMLSAAAAPRSRPRPTAGSSGYGGGHVRPGQGMAAAKAARVAAARAATAATRAVATAARAVATRVAARAVAAAKVVTVAVAKVEAKAAATRAAATAVVNPVARAAMVARAALDKAVAARAARARAAVAAAMNGGGGGQRPWWRQHGRLHAQHHAGADGRGLRGRTVRVAAAPTSTGATVTSGVPAPKGGGGGGGQFVSPASVQVDATLRRFGRTMERHVQGFMNTQRISAPSGEMTGALAAAQRVFVERVEAHQNEGGGVLAPAEMVDALREQKQALKNVASTQEERATIEVVALLFQSILTEDRIPTSVRVWFARLQMPTLRVAMSEPDFFSSAQHPARRLIDRMGACVMGFDAAPQGAGPELEGEVARVVQVVEAFPETGRKVFQTVLVEFERFIERYFRDQNETTKKGVSLASQVEQRETLAIQYTIELRKLLDGVPVQDGVREFLFQVWADVLATTAMRHGLQSAGDARSCARPRAGAGVDSRQRPRPRARGTRRSDPSPAGLRCWPACSPPGACWPAACRPSARKPRCAP